MNATNPIQIDGKSYDRYSLNLAITGRYLTDGSPDASIAMRLIPTRLDGGEASATGSWSNRSTLTYA